MSQYKSKRAILCIAAILVITLAGLHYFRVPSQVNSFIFEGIPQGDTVKGMIADLILQSGNEKDTTSDIIPQKEDETVTTSDIIPQKEDETVTTSDIIPQKEDETDTITELIPQSGNREHTTTLSIPQDETEGDNWRCEDAGFIGNTTKTAVALIKVHKTGSSTVAGILYRFGIRRGLSFITPNGRGLHFWPGTIDKAYKNFSPSCKDKYEILNIHGRYNGRDILTRYMRDDTYVIAPLRHPKSQMISGLNFYGYVKRLKKIGKTIKDFFDHPQYLTKDKVAEKLLWNSMSSVVGLDDYSIPAMTMKSALKSNPTYMKEIEKFLDYADKNVDFFLIREKFDESLILLKDRLGWRIEDMIYFTLNSAADPPEKANMDEETLLAKTEEFSYIDYLLYERMKEKLDRMIEKKGAELEVEVAELRRLNKEFSDYCLEEIEVDQSLYGAWNLNMLGNKLKSDLKNDKCCRDTALDEVAFYGLIKKYMANNCH